MGSQHNKKLASDTKPQFDPAYTEDLFTWGEKRGVGNHERAATGYGLFHQLWVNREGLDDIRQGADTRKLWLLATTHRDVYMSIRTVIGAAMWVSGVIGANNNYAENPQFEKLDKIIISLINDTLENLQHQSFAASITDLLLYGMICGYGVAEKIWESIDGRWILRALKTKPSYDFTPIVDSWYNLQEIWHYPTGSAFHPGAFVWAPWPRCVGGNWLGVSELLSVRHDLLLLAQLEAVQAKNATMLSRSPVIDEINQTAMSPGEIAAHRRSIEDVYSGNGNGILHVPASKNDKGEFSSRFKITIPENVTGVAAMQAAEAIIAESKKEIKRALGSPDDLGNTTVSSGSRAKTEAVLNVLIIRAEEGQRWQRDIINRQIIADIIKYNYPVLPPYYQYPTWEYPEIQEEFNTDKANFISSLTQTGILTNENDDLEWARKFLGMPPLPKNSSKIIKPVAGEDERND